MTAAEVGGHLGAHPNTARFHLEALCDSGFASRVSEAPASIEGRHQGRRGHGAPGRPRVHYVVSAAAPPAAPRSYRLLAEILTAQLAQTAPDPAGAAASAGSEYGRRAASLHRRPSTPHEAGAVVVESLGAMGFESRATDDSSGIRIDVTTCPFLEVATGHLEVVCAVHRGLMQGLLGALDAPAEVDRLEPLVAPSHCIAHLSATA